MSTRVGYLTNTNNILNKTNIFQAKDITYTTLNAKEIRQKSVNVVEPVRKSLAGIVSHD
jgi:hypothetical protein